MGMILACPAAQQVDLSRWKVIIGGSALTKGLAQAATSLGIQIYQGYGMSETAPVLALTHLNDTERNGSGDEQLALRTRAGRTAPFVEFKLVDDTGNDVPHDGQSVGELVVRAPWLTQGYYQDPEREKTLWQGGWLHTGDVASITPNNWVQIADRLKDVIKTGGEWVSSLDMENVLSQLEGVAESAVVGITSERWGERPHALVVLKPGYELNEASIKQQLQAKVDKGELNKWYVPDGVHLVAAIPKTSVGKIDKKQIRAELNSQLANSTSAS
jgi:fatty-acyl-CoA synthase